MNDIEDDDEISKKVFGMFIEQAQNVIRYSQDRIATGGTGTIAISRADDAFIVEAINPMNPDFVDDLRKNLEELKSMDNKELRKAYKKRLLKDLLKVVKVQGWVLLKWLEKVINLNLNFQNLMNYYLFLKFG